MEQENQNQEFQVITETQSSQRRKKLRGKLTKKILVSILCGVIFGACAAVTFGLIYGALFEKQTEEKVKERLSLETIPEENAQEESDVSDVPEEGEALAGIQEQENEDETDQTQDEEETQEPESQQIFITEEQVLTVEQYQVLYNKLITVGTRASRSIVSVYHILKRTDIFELSYENSEMMDGLIVAKDGTDVLILTRNHFLHTDGELYVQAADAFLPAEVVSESETYGIAVLRVDASELGEEKLENIEIAGISPSTAIYTGRFVLAVGNSRGVQGEVMLGAVSSVRQFLPITDGAVSAILTNIDGGSVSGFLVNTNGNFVGMYLPQITASVAENIVCAVSLGDMQPMIEKLLNGETPVTVGLELAEQTEENLSVYDLPIGVFVRNVEMESPAFKAGVQSGDIITKINGTEIASIAEYESALLDYDGSGTLALSVEREVADGYEPVEITINFEER